MPSVTHQLPNDLFYVLERLQRAADALAEGTLVSRRDVNPVGAQTDARFGSMNLFTTTSV